MYTVFGTSLGNRYSRKTEGVEDENVTEDETRNGIVSVIINLCMDNPHVPYPYIEVTGVEEYKAKTMWDQVANYVNEHVHEILGE